MSDNSESQLSPQDELALYQEMHRNIPAVLYRYVVHPDGRALFDYVSDGVEAMTGTAPAEVLSDSEAFLARMHPDDVQSFQQSVMRSAETMGLFYWEGRAFRANGEEYWMRATSRPHRTTDGSIVWDGLLIDVTESVRTQQAARQTAEQEALIREQAELLAELSTPLIPLTESVLVMPLIGTINARRAQQVMETLLEGIVHYQAETVLLDITGVKTVDTAVANALIQVARAVSLIGSKMVLTGIQPRIAQTLVQLGVSLGDVVTYSTLQAGITTILAAQHVLGTNGKRSPAVSQLPTFE